MKRFFAIFLTAVMILATFSTAIVDVAAATDTGGDGSADEIYLSDITPTSWKIFDGCTPGYNVYFEDNTPLLLAGVTYEKGLSTHPGVNFDAEFIYDISGYDYTAFTAIVGKTDRYAAALPGSFITARVYVDGVLADEVIDLVAGKTYTFHVNVAGASELKLVTSPGSDNITCDGVVWANVKLNYDKVDPVVPEDSPELYLSDITPQSATALTTPGYNKNEQGEPLLLDGVVYEKGIWTHPLVDGDAVSVYDLSGYSYTTFSAIVGKEQKYADALPGSLLTFRVYVDGVLADEVVDMVAGETYTFMIDITGASELKLVTGKGSDEITCDGSIWANAKLSYGNVEPVDPPLDPEASPELYLSDITPQSATALTTPGYNKNEQGEPLLLDGVTYAKGIWTHPLVDGDAVSVYDLSGYSYTTFSAIVGKEQKYADALPGSLLTFRVYVDGVLADEVVNIVAGETYTFMIDITGASELKLVTGKGSDEITCDGSIWANAKLSYGNVEPVDPPLDPEDSPAEGIYLSDIKPVSWKIIDGSKPGYNVYFEDNTPLALAGKTYEKGLSTHPGAAFDAEFVYDIKGYDYTTFTAIVGKTDRYVAALPGSLTSFQVYVDGVLADEVVDLVAGDTYTFRVNVTGASELKLVSTPGSDNITCDGVIWANAKLIMTTMDCGDHTWENGKIVKEPSCTEVGQMKYQCANCLQEKVEDVSVVPHTAGEWEMGEGANCTEAGTKLQACTVCGEIVDTVVWDAKGHVPGVWVTTKSATCTEAGKKEQTCQVCGTVLTEDEIPALGHFFGEWGTLDGKQVRLCECGEQEIRDNGGLSPVVIVAGVVVLLAAGAVTFLVIKKKR